MGTVLRDEEREFGPAPTRFRLTLTVTHEWPPEEHVSAAHCLAFSGDRIVLARHVDRQWTIPGGHVEPGESVIEAMRREALEEAGVVVGTPTLWAVERIERLSGPASSRPDGRPYPEPAYQVFFVAPVVAELVAPTANEECTESKLFSPDEARSAPGWCAQFPDAYEAALAWAQDHLCAGCDFVYDETSYAAAAASIRSGAAELAEAVAPLDPSAASARPAPEVWSPVEYACHLRDVLLVQRERAILALVSDEPPKLAPMSRDERVGIEGYAASATEDVARQLVDAAALFTNLLDGLDDAGWARTLVYNYPTVQERTLRWLAVHTLHEVHHHRRDVRGR